MRSSVAGLALLLTLLPAAARGQAATPVHAGDRLRITYHADDGSRRRLEGVLLNDSGPLQLQVGSATETVGQASVLSVQRFDGRRSRGRTVLRSAGIGLLIGGVAGAALGFADGDDPPGWFSMQAHEKAIFAGAGLGGLCMIGGIVVGLVAPRGEVWSSVAVPGLRAAAYVPASGGVGLALAIDAP